MDPNLQSLLKWSVENSSATQADPNAAAPEPRALNPDVLNSLFGGPSDADLMKLSMSAILSSDPEVSLDDKLVAFDNFEQLIENLDNANNLEPLELWTPLLSCLAHEEKDIRRMAAWCVGTAVQNNEASQQRLQAKGGLQLLFELATKEAEPREVRRKACYGLSSAVRNYQPALDSLMALLGRPEEKLDASDMDVVDEVIGPLREEAAKAAP